MEWYDLCILGEVEKPYFPVLDRHLPQLSGVVGFGIEVLWPHGIEARFLYQVLVVLAEFLDEADEVVREVAISHAHDVGFREVADVLHLLQIVAPVASLCKEVDHHRGSALQVFEGCALFALRFHLQNVESLLRELAPFDFLHLFPAHLLGLGFLAERQLRDAGHDEGANAVERHAGGESCENLVVVAERVEQTCFAVVGKQFGGQVEGWRIGVEVGRSAEGQGRCLDERQRYLQLHGALACQLGGLHEFALGRVGHGQSSEGLFEHAFHLVGIEVAAEHEAHVRGHVELFVEGFHLAHARILQVFGAPDDGIFVGRALEHLAQAFLQCPHDDVVRRAVLFFVDRFELALEQSVDGMEEPVAVQREPLSHVLWREDVVIESVVVAGSGI